MESGKQQVNGVGFFQMPLHYPRYTMKDYSDMPEWKLDRLLAEYGLSAEGDLDYKRRFAMGAFLWPDFHGVNQ
ncbi:mannose-1-phosphate guanylyltransferase 1-like [Hibiscus syriacus]|uniref:Mannose-1-phosphate guanylyltransferase 1-like n=1 Tax=Hibiscus syriacus TaxID=106335 RepID=A0A6A3BSS0_HIBSY|nr:mannose-1-phosphate guanylyltransferase 1-like [Hibiscus syriacus]